ncbi:MAG: cytochrome P450, partial [Halioglobus sp.]
GNTHRKYKKATVKAIDPMLLFRDTALLEGIVTDELTLYANSQKAGISPPEKFIRTLNNISTALLIYIFFGARFGTERFEVLRRMYEELGPNGAAWVIGDQQRKSFYEIRDYLNAQLGKQVIDEDPSWRQSIMGQMHNNGALDETSLGNLIYMVEIGRNDLRCLFRWMSKYGAENPEIISRIGTETSRAALSAGSLSKTFVLETLRLNQSERLMRMVSRDIVFDGYHIPKNFMVRLCMWESHKSPDSFDEPFGFKPERFAKGVGKDQFSPFGMDHHSCPFTDISINLGTLFIRLLARDYEVDSVADGSPVRDQYHWQPAKTFSVRLNKRFTNQRNTQNTVTV